MDNKKEQLDAIQDIRALMERSSRFLSLSGLAGIAIGVVAIIGITAAYLYMGITPSEPAYYALALNEYGEVKGPIFSFLFADFILVLIISLIVGVYFSMRKAKKQALPVWDATAKRLLINLAIPLIAGGIYCLILLFHGHLELVVPATLIFYGFALLNASKYTINDIRYLGMLEIVIGLITSFFVGYGLLFWVVGFGVLHIVYGIVIYYKYEQ